MSYRASEVERLYERAITTIGYVTAIVERLPAPWSMPTIDALEYLDHAVIELKKSRELWRDQQPAPNPEWEPGYKEPEHHGKHEKKEQTVCSGNGSSPRASWPA